jgi:hypothetical protein
MVPLLNRFMGILFGITIGGALGATIGWMLGDLGGRYDSQSVMAFAITIGALTGIAVAMARRATGIGPDQNDGIPDV